MVFDAPRQNHDLHVRIGGNMINWKLMAGLAACGIMCSGCSSENGWKSPSGGLITKNEAALFSITPHEDAGVAFFHSSDLNASTSHTSNPKDRTYNYSGTLSAGADIKVTYQLKSDVSQIVISDTAYNLIDGRVFVVTDQGDILQLPFAPLAASEQYLQKLQAYVNANKGIQPTK
jgi:hypothetical protein